MIDPLVPAEVDLRDFPGTMIQRARLFGSTFHSRVTDSEWRAGVTLWLKTWDRVPAGSLPADEIDQCRLAELGRDLKTWRKVRVGALHGWDVATDGLMYHRVVAEVVIEAWLEKLGQQLSGGAGNAKRWGLVFDPTFIQDQIAVAKAMLFTLNPQSRSLRKRRHSGIPTGQHNDPDGTKNHPDGAPDSDPVGIAIEEKGSKENTNHSVGKVEESAGANAPKPPKIARGKRMSPDWSLPEEWGEWARLERPDWDDKTIIRTSFKFRDHWLGKGETKADWYATWRNWVRNELDFKRPGNGNHAPSLAERRADNIADITGRKNARRTESPDTVDGTFIRQDDGDLRQSDDFDVGRRAES